MNIASSPAKTEQHNLQDLLLQKKKEASKLEAITKAYPDARQALIHGIRAYISQSVEKSTKFLWRIFFHPDEKVFFLRKKAILRPRNQEAVEIYSSECRRLSSGEVTEILQTAFNSPFTVDKVVKRLIG